ADDAKADDAKADDAKADDAKADDAKADDAKADDAKADDAKAGDGDEVLGNEVAAATAEVAAQPAKADAPAKEQTRAVKRAAKRERAAEMATEALTESEPAADSEPFANVPVPLRAAIVRRGFSALTPVQQKVLAAGIEKRNIRISSQTGSGKTLALGMVLAADLLNPSESRDASGPRGPHALVIVPTRELAMQVKGELAWLFEDVRELSVEVVTGGTDVGAERRALARNPKIVVGTPGRLLDHMRRGGVKCQSVAHVVLDEADQMLDMGFREELEAIVDQLPEERLSHLVSATFPRAVQDLANRIQTDPLHIEGTRLGAANQDIEHVAHLVRVREVYAALVNLLLLAQGERTLVFVQRRVDASELAEMLAGDGFSALPFSGDLAQAQRTRTLDAFRNGIVNTLISTDVAARGIDVPGISTVIHVDMPKSFDVYTHRSGRTGRAGTKGQSLLLVPAPGERRVRRLLQQARVLCDWRPVPPPAKVKKTLSKRTRTELYALLDAEQLPSETELSYAKSLLEKHDPARLVADLLTLSEPKLPREPMEISQLAPRVEGSAAETRRREPRNPNQSFVRFHVNWGERNGATPARLLSHLCRRGDVTSQAIGSIRIEPRSATFEVSAEMATQFEEKTKNPDSRDPDVRIQRFRGSAGPEDRNRGPRGGYQGGGESGGGYQGRQGGDRDRRPAGRQGGGYQGGGDRDRGNQGGGYQGRGDRDRGNQGGGYQGGGDRDRGSQGGYQGGQRRDNQQGDQSGGGYQGVGVPRGGNQGDGPPVRVRQRVAPRDGGSQRPPGREGTTGRWEKPRGATLQKRFVGKPRSDRNDGGSDKS
ncbi:MAG: DEAD/DEAH box helicase, partial [Polyangiaceae bacterium]|nr:DEAD/DEAH box helicase [Polyangiaceae bacterium]